jgi:hypothetical protein
MNLEKSKKRIAKKVKMGFHGYPEIALEYFGATASSALEVAVTLVMEEGDEPLQERFSSETDVRESEVIQSALVKIIERSGAKTVSQKEGVSLLV